MPRNARPGSPATDRPAGAGAARNRSIRQNPLRPRPAPAIEPPAPPTFPRGCRRARSSVGEHYVDIVGVAGSIPAAPTISSQISSRMRGAHLLRRGDGRSAVRHGGPFWFVFPFRPAGCQGTRTLAFPGAGSSRCEHAQKTGAVSATSLFSIMASNQAVRPSRPWRQLSSAPRQSAYPRAETAAMVARSKVAALPDSRASSAS